MSPGSRLAEAAREAVATRHLSKVVPSLTDSAAHDVGAGGSSDRSVRVGSARADLASRTRPTRYSIGTDSWEVWVCDVPDGSVPITPAQAADVLNASVTSYFQALSANHIARCSRPPGR